MTSVGFGVVKFHHSCCTQASLLKQLFALGTLSGCHRCACSLLNSSGRKTAHYPSCGDKTVLHSLVAEVASLEAG